MIRFYMIRHGETEYNVNDRVQGWCDSPLTSRGTDQATSAGMDLSQLTFSYAACGDLGRHVETAHLILAQNHSGFIPDLIIAPCFRESCFGGFEEKPISELLKAISLFCEDDFSRFSEFREKYSFHEITDIVHRADPTGTAETASDITQRFYRGTMDLAAKAEIAAQPEKTTDNILLVTSGAVLPLFIEYLQSAGRLKDSSRSMNNVHNAEIFILEYDGNSFELK